MQKNASRVIFHGFATPAASTPVLDPESNGVSALQDLFNYFTFLSFVAACLEEFLCFPRNEIYSPLCSQNNGINKYRHRISECSYSGALKTLAQQMEIWFFFLFFLIRLQISIHWTTTAPTTANNKQRLRNSSVDLPSSASEINKWAEIFNLLFELRASHPQVAQFNSMKRNLQSFSVH